jgi:hypothetical protein
MLHLVERVRVVNPHSQGDNPLSIALDVDCLDVLIKQRSRTEKLSNSSQSRLLWRQFKLALVTVHIRASLQVQKEASRWFKQIILVKLLWDP